MRYWPQTWLAGQNTFASAGDCSDADLVLYFGAREAICAPAFYNSLRGNCPTADILGCSTGTAISGAELSDDVACAVAVKFDRSHVKLVSV